jgi:hypothetical protein
MTRPSSGPSQWSSRARAIAADALPAPMTIVRPLGRVGRCGGRHKAGWAAATAASNRLHSWRRRSVKDVAEGSCWAPRKNGENPASICFNQRSKRRPVHAGMKRQLKTSGNCGNRAAQPALAPAPQPTAGGLQAPDKSGKACPRSCSSACSTSSWIPPTTASAIGRSRRWRVRPALITSSMKSAMMSCTRRRAARPVAPRPRISTNSVRSSTGFWERPPR